MNNWTGQKVALMDTTLRDGEQTQGVSFTPVEKTNIAKALLKHLNIDRIEVASARISEGEKEAVQSITKWAATEGFLERVEVLGFVDGKLSINWIIESGAKVVNLLAKGSEKHCHMQLKKTLHEHAADIKNVIRYAHEKGLKVNMYLEDWSNGYADKAEYVYNLMNLMEGQGIENFMLPDTLGVLSPDEVFLALTDMISRFPWANFNFHPHNDYGLATANALAAVKAGVRCLHTTVNCLGERAGNASMAEVVVALKDKMGVLMAIDESHLAGISEMVQNFSGKYIASNTPILGEDVFTQTCGVHADGDKKGNLYHNRIQPERFGRIRSYGLGKLSGKASLKQNLDQLGLELSEEMQKKVLDRIIQLGDSKKIISATDLPFIITDVMENNEYNRLRLTNCAIVSNLDLDAIATLKVIIDTKEYSATGSGNGGYDAFMTAMKSILNTIHLECPDLVDYEVRIPKGGQTNALTEAKITWEFQGKRFKTIGVDSDQVVAAINATMRMLNLRMAQQNPRNLKIANG